MESNSERKARGIVEEISVKSEQVVERIKELIREGNVRRLAVKTPAGRVLVEMPMTAGVFIGSVATILAPVVVVLAALGGVVADMKIVVERNGGSV